MLMTAYIPMVSRIADKVAARIPACALVGADDLLSHGMFGLRDAIGKFDPDRGVQFTTYAPRRIHGAMMDGIRNMDYAPRLMRKRGSVPQKHSIDMPVATNENGNEVRVHDLLPAAAATDVETRDSMAVILKGFTRAEQMVIRLYYETELTMREIGRAIGFSESRVSQMHAQLLDRLRAKLTREGLTHG